MKKNVKFCDIKSAMWLRNNNLQNIKFNLKIIS